MSAMRLLAAVLLLSPSLLVVSAAASDPKTCPANDPTCRDNDDSQQQCKLYMAPSSIPNGGIGIYTAIDVPEGHAIGEPEMYIPMTDKYKTVPYRGQHRWLPWLSYIRGTTEFFFFPPTARVDHVDPGDFRRFPVEDLEFTDDVYKVDAFAPGLASQVNGKPECPFDMEDIEKNDELEAKDSAGLHRSKDPGVGAFTPHHWVTFSAEDDIPAGSELFVDSDLPLNTVKEPDWLKENGMCIDNIRASQSTIDQAGRGAFAKHFISKGSVLAPAPLIVLKRDDLVLYETDETQQKEENVLQKDKVLGNELLMNYCYGHPDSPLLLLPLSPIVNFINHNGKAPNAKIRWPEKSTLGLDPKTWLSQHPLEVLDMNGEIMMEYVALRDIMPGEEIVIDYGKDWQEAWDKHVKEWSPKPEYKDYVSAADYVNSGAFTIKTEEEQKDSPYPDNLQTVCTFRQPNDDEGEHDCQYPCTILSREGKNDEEDDDETYYTIHVTQDDSAISMQFSNFCVVPKPEQTMSSMPSEFITIVDKWGTTDQHLYDAFRHEIGVPEDFFPDEWKQPAVYEVARPNRQLEAGEFFQMTWAHNGEVVDDNAFFVGLPQNMSAHLRDYCERMGITDMYRKVLYDEPIDIGNYYIKPLAEGHAYVQRPDKRWNSNMHFIIPQDEEARVSYLRALGTGGFDKVLEGAGKTHPWVDGLTCFHNTFLGVSKADDSYMHTDFHDSGNKSFNFVFPIIKVNNSKTELDIQSDDGNIVVGVKYEYDLAVHVGDWAYHKTAAVDYTATGEFRMMASIYCSEINEDTKDSLHEIYKAEDPAPFHDQFDLPVKEWHYGHGGHSLPK